MAIPASQRQALINVAGIPGTWSNKGGGDTTSSTTDVYNGGQLQPIKLAGPPVTANVTVSRPFDPAVDGPLSKRLTPKIGQWRSTVSVQWTDADLVPVGSADVYPNALLVKITPPDVDASSGSAAMIELEFAVGGSV